MFKLNPNPSFWAKAPISVPGQKDPVMIDVEYKHLDKDQLKVFQDGADGAEPVDVLSEIILDWKSVDVDYTKENLAKMLKNYPASGREFYNTYISEQYGVKAKN